MFQVHSSVWYLSEKVLNSFVLLHIVPVEFTVLFF